MEEFEAKFLNVDIEALEKRLVEIGATKVGEFFYKRQVMDYPDLRMDSSGAWLRVRDEGDRVTLGYKRRLGMDKHDGSTSDTGMEEIEVTVSDFDKTRELLHKVGLIDKFYQENKRIRWEKDGVEFDIDSWPKLNPYLEIEADSWEKVDQAIGWLGLDPADKKVFSTNQIYNAEGIRELDYVKMGFDEFIEREK